MRIRKLKEDGEFSYKCFDKETEHYMIFNDGYGILGWDYINNDHELLAYIFNVLDDQGEFSIIKAKDVSGSPYKEGYFIY